MLPHSQEHPLVWSLDRPESQPAMSPPTLPSQVAMRNIRHLGGGGGQEEAGAGVAWWVPVECRDPAQL